MSLPPYHIINRAHVTHVLNQQVTGLLLTPVSRRVERRPTVTVPTVHVHQTLQQHPDTDLIIYAMKVGLRTAFTLGPNFFLFLKTA